MFFAKVCMKNQGLSVRGMALSKLHLVHEKAGGLESWRAEETVCYAGRLTPSVRRPPLGGGPHIARLC